MKRDRVLFVRKKNSFSRINLLQKLNKFIYRLTFFFFWDVTIRSVLSESLSDSRSNRLIVSLEFGFSILLYRMSRTFEIVDRPWPMYHRNLLYDRGSSSTSTIPPMSFSAYVVSREIRFPLEILRDLSHSVCYSPYKSRRWLDRGNATHLSQHNLDVQGEKDFCLKFEQTLPCAFLRNFIIPSFSIQFPRLRCCAYTRLAPFNAKISTTQLRTSTDIAQRSKLRHLSAIEIIKTASDR